MSPLKRYVKSYLNGKGALVEGASIVSERPSRMGQASDVTRLMRESFKEQRRDGGATAASSN